MDRVLYTLTSEGQQCLVKCKQCGLTFTAELTAWGKKRIDKWMAYHRFHHSMIDERDNDQ